MNLPAAKTAFKRHTHEAQPQNWDEVLATETRPIPDYVTNFGPMPEGPTEVPTRWYTDPAVFADEVENIWKKKWQMACRLDHIANKGDTYLHEVAGLSFIVVRVDDDVVKGYWNSCLHRGVPLRQCAGRVDRLQCPFHGFTWSLAGKSVLIPHAEDFPQIDQENFSLPEVQIALWQGWVMINPDLQAEPFESYVGDLDRQFERFPWTDREVTMQIRKVFPANWKAVQEAFMESFHVLTTHPQLAFNSAGERCNTFAARGNVSRGILAIGQTSDYVAQTPGEQLIYERMNGFWDDEAIPDGYALPEGVTARQANANRNRNLMRPALGDVVDLATDSEAGDVYYFTLFPNFHPFGMMQSFAYRFYPHTSSPDACVMEITFLAPVVGDRPRKEPPPAIELGAQEEFVAVEKLGSFGSFISQDSSNLAGIMKGMRNSQTGYVQFAEVHESKIRHFYQVYEGVMGLSAEAEVAEAKARRAAA